MPEEEALVIGLDIGGSKTLAGLVTRAGGVGLRMQVATAPSPAAILAAARSLCEDLIDIASAPVLGIGIGSAGIIDTKEGRVIFANENLPGWTGTRLTDLEIGVSLPFTAENDVRALAFGEAMMGAGADYDSLLCVTVGTGIGGALIMNGEVWHGANYSAGEIGYLVVDWEGEKPMILDQYASGPAIERAYQAAAGRDRRLPLEEIAQLAREGDGTATEAIRMKARLLGRYSGWLRHLAQSGRFGGRWWGARDRRALVGCAGRGFSRESAAAGRRDATPAGDSGRQLGHAGRGNAGLENG